MSIYNSLAVIQQGLHAPKDAHNKFGKYNYRSAESILQALKPLLLNTNCVLILNDEIVDVGGRNYIKATATLADSNGEKIEVAALAREPVSRKGMDEAQVTGATSSYARKYALSGLFAIDDNKDADSLNDNPDYTKIAQPIKPTLTDAKFKAALHALKTTGKDRNGNPISELTLKQTYLLTPKQINDLDNLNRVA